MYDAKEMKEDKEELCTQYDCIYDRNYFSKIQSENIMRVKTAYIPNENVLE